MHVPYKGGGAALTSVIAGEIMVYFAPLGVAMPHVQSGRLRQLGGDDAQARAVDSELPTVAETGFPGYESATGSA